MILFIDFASLKVKSQPSLWALASEPAISQKLTSVLCLLKSCFAGSLMCFFCPGSFQVSHFKWTVMEPFFTNNIMELGALILVVVMLVIIWWIFREVYLNESECWVVRFLSCGGGFTCWCLQWQIKLEPFTYCSWKHQLLCKRSVVKAFHWCPDKQQLGEKP